MSLHMDSAKWINPEKSIIWSLMPPIFKTLIQYFNFVTYFFSIYEVTAIIKECSSIGLLSNT